VVAEELGCAVRRHWRATNPGGLRPTLEAEARIDAAKIASAVRVFLKQQTNQARLQEADRNPRDRRNHDQRDRKCAQMRPDASEGFVGATLPIAQAA